MVCVLSHLCARLQPCSFCVTAVACLPASAGIGCRHGGTCRISASQKEGSMAGEVQWSAACGHGYLWISYYPRVQLSCQHIINCL